jgi:hypothetical protein
MLNCIGESLTAVTLLAAVDAANTAAATSAYVDVRGFEGQIAVILDTGILDDGTVTYTFDTATDSGATGTAAVVPITGAPTVVTTSNDPLVQIAVFEATQLKGFLRVVGTKASAGGVLVSYTAVGIKKYAT